VTHTSKDVTSDPKLEIVADENNPTALDETPASETSPVDEAKFVSSEETSPEEVTTVKSSDDGITSETTLTVTSEIGKLMLKIKHGPS